MNTPRTDAEYQRLGARHGRVRVSFARTLERELAQSESERIEAVRRYERAEAAADFSRLNALEARIEALEDKGRLCK